MYQYVIYMYILYPVHVHLDLSSRVLCILPLQARGICIGFACFPIVYKICFKLNIMKDEKRHGRTYGQTDGRMDGRTYKRTNNQGDKRKAMISIVPPQ